MYWRDTKTRGPQHNCKKCKRREKVTEKKRILFPNAVMRTEGGCVTPQGDYVQIHFADLSGQIDINGLCLVKASEPEFNLATSSTLQISRPSKFRNKGEVLIRDEREGRVENRTEETEEFRPENADVIDERIQAINNALRLGPMKHTVNARQKNTRSRTSVERLTFSKDWMVYCTSMRPAKEEEKAWRETLPDSYTSVAYIYRPSQFAQGIGLAVSEHIGTGGELQPLTSEYRGYRKVVEQRRTQMILHGPMLYVDNPYRYINEADIGWEKILAMAFLKSTEKNYAAMKEYRFVILEIAPEVGEVFDLPVSGQLRDCLEPVRQPGGILDSADTVLSEDDTPESEPKKTAPLYTYRRNTKRRESASWSGGEPGDDRVKEEVVEEEVTSPEELPDPFREEKTKHPDVIVFQQFGRRFHYVHTAYWQEETQRWSVKILQQKDVDEGAIDGLTPEPLKVPDELRHATLEENPVDPRLILDMCLNPSVPRPPLPHPRIAQFNESDLEYLLACGQSLTMAVDLLDGFEQARAAAAAWYAQRFVVDLVGVFGPIIKSVRLIRGDVAVVELVAAPETGAEAWAAFSGVGAYTLWVDGGTLKERVLPGGASRSGVLGPATFAEPLEQHGWRRKQKVKLPTGACSP